MKANHAMRVLRADLRACMSRVLAVFPAMTPEEVAAISASLRTIEEATGAMMRVTITVMQRIAAKQREVSAASPPQNEATSGL